MPLRQERHYWQAHRRLNIATFDDLNDESDGQPVNVHLPCLACSMLMAPLIPLPLRIQPNAGTGHQPANPR